MFASCVTSATSNVDPRVPRSRAKLLAAALDLLVESGAHSVTVDAVAERSGVAKSTLYRHWASRTELLADVLETNAPTIPQPPMDQGFATAFRALVTQLGQISADPAWKRVFPALLSLRRELPEVDSVATADTSQKLAVLASVLNLGVAEGAVPDGVDVELVALQLLGPFAFSTLVGSEVSQDALVDDLVQRFLAGWAAPGYGS